MLDHDGPFEGRENCEGIDTDGSERVDIDQCQSDKLSRVGQYAHSPGKLRGDVTALWPIVPCGLRWLSPCPVIVPVTISPGRTSRSPAVAASNDIVVSFPLEFSMTIVLGLACFTSPRTTRIPDACPGLTLGSDMPVSWRVFPLVSPGEQLHKRQAMFWSFVPPSLLLEKPAGKKQTSRQRTIQ